MNILFSLIRALKLKSFKRSFKALQGSNCNIEKGSFVFSENIKIGDNVHVGSGALWNALGGIEINDNVIIGPNSVIWTFNHNYNSEKFLPYDEVEILKKVQIKSNVWIGANVMINPGIEIGEGSIIAMGSVVVKNVEPCTIVGGNPAQKIGERDIDYYQKIISQPNNKYSYLYNKNTFGLEKITKRYKQ